MAVGKIIDAASGRELTFTREEKLKALVREIALRQNVYPVRIKAGKMRPEQAVREIAIMLAIAKDYGGTG